MVEDNRKKLMEMIHGNWVTQCLYVAAKLGVADLLKDGAKNSADLARSLDAHPQGSTDSYAPYQGWAFFMRMLITSSP